MLRKFILTVFCVSIGAMAQAQTSSDCHHKFTASSKMGEEASPRLKSAIVEYDFSELSGKGAVISLEVIPIMDCWNEVGGEQLKDKNVIRVEESGLKGSATFRVVEMAAKCFKWRFVIDAEGCHEETAWTFQSIIPNHSK